MSFLLLVPPVALTLLVLVVWALSGASASLSFKRKGGRGALDKPYAGGETLQTHRVQVDYGEFFPLHSFSRFCTWSPWWWPLPPRANLQGLAISLIYVMGALLGLVILYRR